jgi:hypothetical protein
LQNVADLIHGSIDLHLHVEPDESPHCVDAIEAARQAAQAGMRAIVIKNHNYPNQPLALTAERLVPGVRVFGSLTLDDEIGGLNACALEVSAKLGAKVVWLPVLSAANSRSKMRRTMGLQIEGDGFSILQSDGRLVTAMQKVLSLVKKYDLVLATGHISPAEIFVLVEAAHKLGIWKLLVTHASNTDVLERSLSIEEQQRLAALGVFLEYVAFELVFQPEGKEPTRLAEMVRAVGAEHCVLSTDMGHAFLPPPVEGLKIALSKLLEKGFTPEELAWMVRKNPARLLGLE